MLDIRQKFSKSRQKGNLGEDLAFLFLMKQGFKIIDRNYLRPWGEIDIVAKRRGASSRGTRGTEEVLHFIEVKSISTGLELPPRSSTPRVVSHEIEAKLPSHRSLASKRPEENMTENKLKKLERTIKTYLLDKKLSHETPFQIDLLTVRIDFGSKAATVEVFEKVS